MSYSSVSPAQIPMAAEWNRTDAPYAAACIHTLFEEQVRRTPDKVAACFNELCLTYSELDRRTSQLAHHFLELGVGPDVLVGFLHTRTLDMLVALLAILKAGGAYLFLDPAYPKDRLSFMLRDSKAQFLVTERQLVSEHLQCKNMVILDEEETLISTRPTNSPSVEVSPGNLAYVLYTSGSTGRPKGVQIEHRSVVNVLTSLREIIGFSADDVLLAITTLSFDIAGLELYLPLASGGRVVLASRETALDGRKMLSAIEQHRITVVQATPVTWQLLLDAGWKNTGMKILCGGEALRGALAARLVRNSSAVWNLYGPTETTIWSSAFRVANGTHAVVPIGRPIANTQMYILDPALVSVATGETGELYIGGDGLARGYLNRPELTAQRFIPNPFHPGTRLYKTGDLARYLPSGDIEFLGRTDHQVKIRGFRIELGEIEALLEEHSDVVQAVVTASETGQESRLTAYFVAKPGKYPKWTELRHWLSDRLPGYMIPALFLRMDSMPVTPNGKVDRRALPTCMSRELSNEHLRLPGDVLEARLVGIWEKILGRSGIETSDNFFDLGGDSLVAAKVIQWIDEEWGLKLPVVILLRSPTIQQLARILKEEIKSTGSSSPSSDFTQAILFQSAHQNSIPRYLPRKSILRRSVNRVLHLLSRLLPGNSTVRPFLHRLRGVRVEGRVFIGDDVYIENEFPERVEVYDGATIGLRTTIVAHAGGAGRIVIGKNAYIGTSSVLVTSGNRTLTIGEGSVVMAGSVVTGDIAPFTVCGIERARPMAAVTGPFTIGSSYEEFITHLVPLERGTNAGIIR